MNLGPERGYSMIEMLVTLAILGTVMTALTGLFVSGTRAELDLNQRFQAQQDSRLAISKLRRDIHCADAVVGSGLTFPRASLTLNLPNYCRSGTGQITWCTIALGTSRYGLYRAAAPTCTTANGTKWADYLVDPNVIVAHTPQDTTRLASVRVRVTTNVTPGDGRGQYKLEDELVLRNTTRS